MELRVKPFQLNACVVSCELPVGLDVVFVAIVLPGGDFVDQCRLVGNAAVQALGCEHAEFELRHVKPTAVLWRVMPCMDAPVRARSF